MLKSKKKFVPLISVNLEQDVSSTTVAIMEYLLIKQVNLLGAHKLSSTYVFYWYCVSSCSMEAYSVKRIVLNFIISASFNV